jgi:hypothetical protein
MIRKSGNRFSENIMRNQNARAPIDSSKAIELWARASVMACRNG